MVQLFKNLLNSFVTLVIILLCPIAFFLQILFGEETPTTNEVYVFLGLSILMVFLSLATRFFGKTKTMNFIGFYSFLFTVFWIVCLVDSLKYEREQMLDFIRFIGFFTALVSTLFNVKINQLTLANRPN
ncbi:hypothetical protein IHV12_17320 [Fictibacillus sp. 7GRE50]|uniref:hypothetical protein n=1 Tax=Fictibacillus sp. 7GRE50 TaxID=2745878 RepID=UPI0018CF6AC0|nr:hypothetical protein [Fictibacillus sp. 7GRE50]MBH0166684.1 hypothetical protein [Fictibacillus sp. 7GRE50]